MSQFRKIAISSGSLDESTPLVKYSKFLVKIFVIPVQPDLGFSAVRFNFFSCHNLLRIHNWLFAEFDLSTRFPQRLCDFPYGHIQAF
jgi:hypothetical protein